MGAFESGLYDVLLGAGAVSAAAVFGTLFVITAPYGRYTRTGWGPTVDPRLGWLLMESGAVFFFVLCFLWGNGLSPGPQWVFAGIWLVHYGHRAFVYPARLSPGARRTPLSIVGMGLFFNLFNGYMNGRWLGLHGSEYGSAWFMGIPFLAGVGIFVLGLVINITADNALLRLRREHPGEYRIPEGGLYRFISCPNYLGEILEWVGFALATFSPAAVLFAAWTIANLAPRAHAHHRWYHERFPEYPRNRKALLPGLW